MCGLCGGFVMTGDRLADAGVVRRMNHHQRRRGPDGEGLWTSSDGRLTLGHRRLALVDLSDAGAQPMSDASGRWVVTFNGEIYNHIELRRELERLGRRFRTACDTEVLLNAFAQWGESALRRLRGMYAFALHDRETGALWLARDPFGVKPLYYAQSAGTLWFASQARALAECAPVNTRRDPAGLVGFYLFGYVPEPFTWWEGVKILPAGHLMKLEAGKDMPAPRAFATIEDMFIASAPAKMTEMELREALRASVQKHLIADAPVGVFLSAGVDSTAIATLAAGCGSKLRTVTLAFDEYRGRQEDEAALAEANARALGAEHRTVKLSRDEFFGLIDDFFAAMDQPTTDGLNTFLVSRAAAAAGLKAALSGLGGDEIFGGYPSFSQVPKLAAFTAPRPMRERLGKICERWAAPFLTALGINSKYASLLRYSGDLESAYFLQRCLHVAHDLEHLLDQSWREEGLERLGLSTRGVRRVGRLSAHAEISLLELTRYMRNQPLRDADWSSMANGLEVRVPFLDISFFKIIAPSINSVSPPKKTDLARACGALAERAAERSKTGFVTPVDAWLRESSAAFARGGGLRPWAGQIGAAFRCCPPVFGAKGAVLRNAASY